MAYSCIFQCAVNIWNKIVNRWSLVVRQVVNKTKFRRIFFGTTPRRDVGKWIKSGVVKGSTILPASHPLANLVETILSCVKRFWDHEEIRKRAVHQRNERESQNENHQEDNEVRSCHILGEKFKRSTFLGESALLWRTARSLSRSRKVRWGVGIFEPHEFFSLTFPWYEFFLTSA